jgi:hypothetical protein
MTVIKVSDDLMKKLGATNSSEFAASVEALLAQETPAPQSAVDLKPVMTQLAALRSDVEALSVLVLEPKENAWSADEVVRIATIAASKITSGALAATGTNPAPIGVPNTTVAGTQEIAEDDYDGQWKASEQLRGEFGGNYKTYAAYKKAAQNGRFKLLSK